VTASTDAISGFSFEPTGANTYRMQVGPAWQGSLPDGKPMLAKTRHAWTVIDPPQERFARVKTVAVQVLEPLAPQPQGHAAARTSNPQRSNRPASVDSPAAGCQPCVAIHRDPLR
jgi:hypothetical protein